MKHKYKIVSKKCVNSNWIAQFLAEPKQEGCQCMFGCKIKVEHDSGYEYIISESEYLKLNENKELIKN